MVIYSADFLCSSPHVDLCPESNMPEFAFIGRSNVGKSSLINMLTRRKGLAKVSSTPGKTQMINHFTINNEWNLVDLPGYGYARVGRSKQLRFTKLIESYILERKNLVLLFLLIDCRHEPQKIDLKFIRFLGENGIPFVIIFTKTDKLSKTQLQNNIESYRKALSEEWEELPLILPTSAEKGEGREEVLDYISKCLNEYKKQ